MASTKYVAEAQLVYGLQPQKRLVPIQQVTKHNFYFLKKNLWATLPKLVDKFNVYLIENGCTPTMRHSGIKQHRSETSNCDAPYVFRTRFVIKFWHMQVIIAFVAHTIPWQETLVSWEDLTFCSTDQRSGPSFYQIHSLLVNWCHFWSPNCVL